jgi:hypothetical protein
MFLDFDIEKCLDCFAKQFLQKKNSCWRIIKERN